MKHLFFFQGRCVLRVNILIKRVSPDVFQTFFKIVWLLTFPNWFFLKRIMQEMASGFLWFFQRKKLWSVFWFPQWNKWKNICPVFSGSPRRTNKRMHALCFLLSPKGKHERRDVLSFLVSSEEQIEEAMPFCFLVHQGEKCMKGRPVFPGSIRGTNRRNDDLNLFFFSGSPKRNKWKNGCPVSSVCPKAENKVRDALLCFLVPSKEQNKESMSSVF